MKTEAQAASRFVLRAALVGHLPRCPRPGLLL